MAAGDFPIINIYSFDTTELASPVGLRNTPQAAPSYKRKISFECSTFNPNKPLSTSGVLDFEDIKFNIVDLSSHVASKVAAIVFQLVTADTTIANMRLYVVDNTALRAGVTDTGTEPARLQFATSGIWQPNPTWPSGIHSELPQDIPFTANVLRQDGGAALTSTNDSNSSQFVYMNMIVPLGFPLGHFGACGSGLLRLGLVFDYYAT